MFDEGKGISLGGRKGSARERATLLESARQARRQRAVAAAPSKSAAALGRCLRGWFARRRAAALLRASLVEAVQRSAAPDAVERRSLTRRLCLLRRLRTLPREEDEQLIEASCERLLSAAPPLGDGPSGADWCACAAPGATAAFLRRASLLLPVLVGQPGEAAGRLLFSICGLAEAESATPPFWAACCRDGGQRQQRALLLGAAPSLLPALAAALFVAPRDRGGGAAPDGAAPDGTRHALRLVRLCRAALGVSADDAPGSTGGTGVAAPALFELTVSSLPLVSWLGMAPLHTPRHAVLRAFFAAWSEKAWRTLEHALASWVKGWLLRAGLDAGLQSHAAAQLLAELVAVCARGEGADWRAGGWAEGRPRRLSEADLDSLLQAQVARLCRRCPWLSVANASALLLRCRWSLEKAAADADADASAGAGAATDGMAVEATVQEAVMAEAEAEAEAGAEVVMTEAEAGAELAVCGICFDAPEPPESLAALRCGHAYCTGCWGELLRHSLEAGGKGLLAACPQPGCDEPLSGEAWAAWLPPSAAPLLRRLTLRSFVEGNTLLCWCPSFPRLQPHARQRLQPHAREAATLCTQVPRRGLRARGRSRERCGAARGLLRVRRLLLCALLPRATLARHVRAAAQVGGDAPLVARRAVPAAAHAPLPLVRRAHAAHRGLHAYHLLQLRRRVVLGVRHVGAGRAPRLRLLQAARTHLEVPAGAAAPRTLAATPCLRAATLLSRLQHRVSGLQPYCVRAVPPPPQAVPLQLSRRSCASSTDPLRALWTRRSYGRSSTMPSPRRLARSHHRPTTTTTTSLHTPPLSLPVVPPLAPPLRLSRDAAGRWRRRRSPRSCRPFCARCGCASGRRSTPFTRQPGWRWARRRAAQRRAAQRRAAAQQRRGCGWRLVNSRSAPTGCLPPATRTGGAAQWTGRRSAPTRAMPSRSGWW